MMKKPLTFVIILTTLLMTLAGCAVANTANKKPNEMPAPKVDSADAKAPATEEQNDVVVEKLTLSPYFPAKRITLPPGSKVLDVFNDFEGKDDGEVCWETTALELGITKTEAIAHFTPMLEPGAWQFANSGDTSEHIHWKISEDYPEVTNYVELFASYPGDYKGADISIIKVSLFTKGDNETIAVALIEVKYEANPTAVPMPAENKADEPEPQNQETGASQAESKLPALKKYALDAGLEVIPDDWRFGWSIKNTAPIGGFDLGIEDYYVSILEFADAGQVSDFMDEQSWFEYEFYSEGGLLAVYNKDSLTNEAAAIEFIGKMFKAAL